MRGCSGHTTLDISIQLYIIYITNFLYKIRDCSQAVEAQVMLKNMNAFRMRVRNKERAPMYEWSYLYQMDDDPFGQT